MQLLLLIRSAETATGLHIDLEDGKMLKYIKMTVWWTHELVEDDEIGVEALVGAGRVGLYGESLLIDGGETLLVDPDAGGLFDFLGRTFVPFELPFCCCCCCWRHLARRFLNHT